MVTVVKSSMYMEKSLDSQNSKLKIISATLKEYNAMILNSSELIGKMISDYNIQNKKIEDLSLKLENMNKQIEDLNKEIDNLNKKVKEVSLSSRGDPPSISSRGDPIKILNPVLNSSYIDMIATAYDLSTESCGKSPSNPNYGITRSGKRAVERLTVAVDPSFIPLGTKLSIIFPDPYKYLNGVYEAMDTGGAVKGNIIDIFLGENERDLCDEFGRRKVKVSIIR
jgi:3D (Asp-Asp-Asp) domain-containing protein/cell division protein FtsB